MATVPDEISVYWEVAVSRYISQEALLSDNKNKVLGMLTVSIALMAAGFFFLGNLEDRSVIQTVPFAISGTWTVAAIIVACICILKPTDWYPGPKPSDISEVLYTYDDSAIRQWVADIYSDSVERNKPILAGKARAMWCIAILLALQSVNVAVAVAIAVIC